MATDNAKLLGFAVVVIVAKAPVYEAAAVFRKCQSRQGDARPRREVAGGSGRSSQEVREEAGRSIAYEVRGVTVNSFECVSVLLE